MKQYDVVIKPTLQLLIETVNVAIEHGYVPIGSLINVDGQYIQPIFLTIKK
jgi:hypothetical protein